jgi:hypothetical protein
MEVKEKVEDNTSKTKTMLVPAGNDLPAKKPLLLQLNDPAIAAAADGRGAVKGGVDDGKKRGVKDENKGGQKGTFKRRDKNRPVMRDGGKGEQIDKKRKMDIDEEPEETGVKKVKVTEVMTQFQQNDVKNAGPADRSYRTP